MLVEVDFQQQLILEAKRWVGVREKGGDNKGKEVELFQKAVDGKAQGESWCLGFVQFCVLKVLRETTLYKTEHCLTLWNKTPKEYRLEAPIPGAIMVWQHAGTSSGHVGIVTRVAGDNINTIEGNTGDGAGVVREGDGVYERTRSKKGTTSMQVLGWIKPYQEWSRTYEVPRELSQQPRVG